MSKHVPEKPDDDNTLSKLSEALGDAMKAMFTALTALMLILAILVVRAMQAVFILARPAAYVGCIVAAGYMSMTLFQTVLVRYGGDLSAGLLAFSSVVIIPAALLVLAGDYGIWSVMLAVAVLEFLAHLGIERAPPVVLALIPVLALSGTIFYFLVHMEDVPETAIEDKENDDEQKRNIGFTVDRDDESNHLHGDSKL